MSTIDTSGVSIFSDLKKALEKKGLEASTHIYILFISFKSVVTDTKFDTYMVPQMALVNPVGEVMEKLQRWDEGRDILRPDSVYLTVGEAVASLSSAVKCQPSNRA